MVYTEFMSKQQKDWFKRKSYGWGWVPVTWQGWLATLAPVGFIAIASWYIFKDAPEDEFDWQRVVVFLIVANLAIAPLLAASYKKGPKPRWQKKGKPVPPGTPWYKKLF